MAKKKKTGRRYSTQRNTGDAKAKSQRIKRILFAVPVVLAVGVTLYLLLSGGDGEASLFENAVGSLVTPVQTFFTNAASSVKGFFTDWHNYGALQSDYLTLEQENEQLKMQIVSAEEASLENERLKSLLDAKDTYASLDPIYAKVIARDAGPWFETFSVNRGSAQGVTTGMAVVNGDGLIGRVYDVGLNYSKIITIIDTRSAVACLIQRTRDNGVMRGQITNDAETAECFVYYLPNVNNISPGDVVVTSGTDSLYPKGLKVGTVTALSLDAGSDGTYAVVNPGVNFRSIEEVFILRTVIESDKETLPEIATPVATSKPTATPDPNSTPEATALPDDLEAEWAYPTTTPYVEDNGYGDYNVADLIEDTWANDGN